MESFFSITGGLLGCAAGAFAGVGAGAGVGADVGAGAGVGAGVGTGVGAGEGAGAAAPAAVSSTATACLNRASNPSLLCMAKPWNTNVRIHVYYVMYVTPHYHVEPWNTVH